jgi:hypothetical protein
MITLRPVVAMLRDAVLRASPHTSLQVRSY